MIIMNNVMDFVKENLGDVVIVSYELKGKDARVIWKESHEDKDQYFSVIGMDRYGKLIEKVGGEA